MIDAGEFVEAARAQGCDWYAGVPCSFLTPFINYVIGDPSLRYVSAANEGDAVAAAAGATIGGRIGIAMMQNSGLGNAVSPLTSLTHVFRIPLLLICTHRGAPGVTDEPQHALMGKITESLFDTMQIPWEAFPSEPASVAPALERAMRHLQGTGRPYALVMQKGTVAPFPLSPRALPTPSRCLGIEGGTFAPRGELLPSRADALERVIANSPVRGSVVIASTGFAGRELYALADRPNHFYMVGSMGCASSLGLGLAMTRPDLRVFVVDGDGAALMRMGNLATIGTYGPPNLLHVLLDNEAHDSTGAQATVSGNVDFAAVAAACGYAHVARAEDAAAIDRLASLDAEGPGFLHLRIRTGTQPDLPRPALSPAEVLARLRANIGKPA